LRRYLTNAYSAEDLATLCADYFRAVYESFTAGMTKGQQIGIGEKADHRVAQVWEDVIAFCRWLSATTDQEFRSPTEAEWEKAAQPFGRLRGGSRALSWSKRGPSTSSAWRRIYYALIAPEVKPAMK